MNRAGTVVGTAQGLAVVRAPNEEFPDVGTRIVDEQLEAIGEVVDVFGPVDRPFLAVSPSGDVKDLIELVGSVVYGQ